MFECLKNSYIYEGDKPDVRSIEMLVEYFGVPPGRAPDLRVVFRLFSNNANIKRTEDVFITSRLDFTGNFNVHLVGMKSDLIDLDRIQDMIIKFYNNIDIEDAFKYYIQFGPVRPFEDFNGRVGRYIFIEHPLKLYLSNILIKTRNRKLHNQLFKCFHKKMRLYYNGNILMNWKTRLPYKYDDEEHCRDIELNVDSKNIIHKLLKKFNQ